ncbi:MAG: hypothetical protein M3133_06180 [Actinomycetota bacterium]|nr:hypothetical protein [Actinomycetota bacterium]
MADAAIFVGFGQAARAREPQALELLEEGVRYFAGLQQRGEIESFEPVVLEPHGGDLRGFVLVRGDHDGLDRLRRDAEFLRLSARASLVVDNFGVVDAYLGEGLQSQLDIFRSQVEEQLRA